MRPITKIFFGPSCPLFHGISFSNVPVSCASFQKDLWIYLDEKLNFNHHTKGKKPKAMKGIGAIKRLSKMLPQHSLLTIYKSFVQPHLDYGDILINQTIKGYVKKLRLFNTMLHWLLLVPSQVHLKLNFTMN